MPGPGVLVLPLFALVALLPAAAPQYQCLFHQHLDPKVAYTITNPGWPARYQPGESCQWVARARDANSKVVLDCDTFDLPLPKNGECGDALWISSSGRRIEYDGEAHCGSGRFTLVSSGQRLNVELRSIGSSPQGGTFRCSVAATDLEEDVPLGGAGAGMPTSRPPSRPPTRPVSKPPPVNRPPLDMGNCTCAARRPGPGETRVVGGAQTAPNEFPMMAYLEDAEYGRLLCGAALLSQRFALTAAHCAERAVKLSIVSLVVGDHDRSQSDWQSSRQVLRVRDFVVHPDYQGNWSKGDLAVVRLKDPARLGPRVQPACLPFALRKVNFAGQPVTVLGWGGRTIGGPNAIRLQAAQLKVVKNSACAQAYNDAISDDHICAFRRDASPCTGDSGGPVVWESPRTGALLLVGIVSYGEGCPGDKPFINTRVSSHLRWIQQTTRESYCYME